MGELEKRMMGMQDAKWFFDEIRPGTKQRDSVSEDFFTHGTRLSGIIQKIHSEFSRCMDSTKVRENILTSSDLTF